MNDYLKQLSKDVEGANRILIIQAENPDGDSLGSALALEDIFDAMGKDPYMYCPVQIPKYLRYMPGWDRVSSDFPNDFDMTIIVDTSSLALMERVFTPNTTQAMSKKPLYIFDHHDVEADLPLQASVINDVNCVATGELIFSIANELSWSIRKNAAELLTGSIMSDSLGLMTPNTTVNSVEAVAKLMKLGVKLSELDARRKELSKKSRAIFDYKGELFKRVEFLLEDQLALIVIPWEDIQKYSDSYNPSMLIMDEARMVEGVKAVVALKTYPDGKVTAKIRSNHGYGLSDKLAAQFGGGGHPYAAGFKVRDMGLDEVRLELVESFAKLLEDNDETI